MPGPDYLCRARETDRLVFHKLANRPVRDRLGSWIVSGENALVAAGAGVVLCGAAAFALGPWVMRRIPEPVLEEGGTKTPYAELAGDGIATPAAYWCGAAAGVAGGLLGLSLGMSAGLAAWFVLAVSGAVLGFIDARTKYLPSAIIWPSYGLVGLALLIGAVVSGDWDAMLRAVIAAVVAFGAFGLLWLVFPAGVGFGDVRLAGLLGLALGWLGWSEVAAGIYLGFLLGAVIGIVLRLVKVLKRRELFPFGPFMLVGALLGVLLGQPLENLYLG